MAPDYLTDILPNENRVNIGYNLRNNANIVIPYTRLEVVRRSFIPFSISLWNQLPLTTRNKPSLDEFKICLLDEFDELNVIYYNGPC